MQYACRKYLPTFFKKLCARGDVEMHCSNTDLLTVKWKDTKEVVVVSNCHKPEIGMVGGKNKDGSQTKVTCPESDVFIWESWSCRSGSRFVWYR